jgi:hypothetical protein
MHWDSTILLSCTPQKTPASLIRSLWNCKQEGTSACGTCKIRQETKYDNFVTEIKFLSLQMSVSRF